VIIPAYNAESTLAETLASLQRQTRDDWEAIVIDDGSTDATLTVARHVGAADARVRVVAQEHGGESAARNTGLSQARGEWLVFLDSDDWLLPRYLEAMTDAAEGESCDVLHCGWQAVGRHGGHGPMRFGPPDPDLFPPLAQSNCLVIHTCLTRRSVSDAIGLFDTHLVTCADWDFWQRAARSGYRFRLVPEVLAAYRLRPNSAGTQARQLLRDAMTVIARGHGVDSRVPRPVDRYVSGMPEGGAPAAGTAFLCWAAGLCIGRGEPTNALWDIIGTPAGPLAAAFVSDVLFESVPIPRGELPSAWTGLWSNVEPELDRFLTRLEGKIATPGLARAAKQDLMEKILRHTTPSDSEGRRADNPFAVPPLTRPISAEWGFDRGRPVDRYYIERFLDRCRADVRGRVLEVGDDTYTRRYGGDRVVATDVLHVEAGHAQATIVADLTDAPQLETDGFDCVILTQTLQLIHDLPTALQTVRRILKPGGVLLATFPGLSRTSRTEWPGSWFWRLTPDSARRMFGRAFETDAVSIESHGNVLAASAFLYGLAADELAAAELDYHDPDYDVVITARVVKANVAKEDER
jgi:SAM-dependent methyltransferase